MYPSAEIARTWAAFWCIVFGLSLVITPSGAAWVSASLASLGFTYLWLTYVVPRLRGSAS